MFQHTNKNYARISWVSNVGKYIYHLNKITHESWPDINRTLDSIVVQSTIS